MKTIINGVRYDTTKANVIGTHYHGTNTRDFEQWEATLYVTPQSGRYFLAGEGGPMTHYARHSGPNSWGGGSRIDPLTKDQAFEWAQRYLEPDDVDKYFHDMIEDA